MMATQERPTLRVEGKDDTNVFRHLLTRHGFDYNSDPKNWPDWYPIIKPTGGKEVLLKSVKTEISANSGRATGFVLDANGSLQNSWLQIAGKLKKAEVEVPSRIPKEGFVGKSVFYQAPVGVWLTPDNERDGALEHFLETLIADEDDLFAHAQESTREARRRGAQFAGHFDKAALHAWLAWQEDPGLPYGSAIRAQFFGHDSEAAKRFIAWFRCLYQPSP